LKKALLIFVGFLLYIFACWLVNFDEQYIILNSSGQDYINHFHLYYNEYLFLRGENTSSYDVISIKWDRIYMTILFVCVCTSRLLSLRNRKFKK